MWIYQKKLQYPVRIKNPNPALASMIISQVGGPDGELSASMRYLHQRYSMPDGDVVGMLTDIGSEEPGHLEMVSAIIHQLTRNIREDKIMDTPFAPYFVDHTTGVYPVSAAGVPNDLKYVGIKGDPIADLNEDLAAEGAITLRRISQDENLGITIKWGCWLLPALIREQNRDDAKLHRPCFVWRFSEQRVQGHRRPQARCLRRGS
jgi:Mn-containing catalase